MRTLPLFASLLLASPAFAGPIIWHKVPDHKIDNTPGAAAAVSHEAKAYERSDAAIERAKEDVVVAKAKAKEARKERRLKRADTFSRFTAWVAARRSADEAVLKRRTAELTAAEDAWDKAKEHYTWHRQARRAEQLQVREAKVQRAIARAELESAQAQALTAKTDAPYYEGARFERQEERLDHRSHVVHSTWAIYADERDDAREAWTAMK